MSASSPSREEEEGAKRSAGAPVARGTWSGLLQPRSPYEATDFGFQFARPYYVTLLAIAAAFIVPMSLVLAPLSVESPIFCSFLLWWAKPLWERPILVHLSRAFFGPAPTRERRSADSDARPIAVCSLR